MKKVSVFTVLTCFLAGTANLPCYAGNSWSFGKSDEPPVDDGPKKTQTQPKEQAHPSTSGGRGAGRGSMPAQPSTSVGRGLSRGGGLVQTLGQDSAQSRVSSVLSKPKPASDLPDFHGTFDDVSPAPSAVPMTEAELALYEQWVHQGKVPGINLTSVSSDQTVPLVHGPVGGEAAEQSRIPSPNPAPSSTTSSLVSGKDVEQSPTSSSLPASSLSASDERTKDDNAITHFVPSGAKIVQEVNYRLAKVPLLCTLTEWEYFSEAGNNPNIRKLYQQEPEVNISQLKNGVAWAKHYLSKKGKELKKIETANAFSQLIEARMNGLIEEVRESIESSEKPSVHIRFLQDKANDKILFSVQRNLGKIILIEIPGQDL